MKRSLTRKQGYSLILSLLLVGAVIVFLYFKLLYPLESELSIKKSELSSEEKMVSMLQSEGSGARDSKFESTVELQKKLPVKSLVEQILLELEKAEVISNSFIVSLNVKEEDAENGNAVAAADKDSGAVEGEAGLPPGVKKVDLELTVQSLSYSNLEAFISSIENSSRIMKVSALKFTGGVEIMSTEQNPERLVYNVTVSAFYHPGLTDLAKDIPPMDKPEPANKKTPFNDNSELPKSESTDS
ncbi:pilus assembly protein PilO [Peribacillus sp. SCS-37]|uniref:pilus assembly protein PilO n=1 Tax=Paraperibacillus esterisolvens TaxID=3115296 RepID=UPI003905DC2A